MPGGGLGRPDGVEEDDVFLLFVVQARRFHAGFQRRQGSPAAASCWVVTGALQASLRWVGGSPKVFFRRGAPPLPLLSSSFFYFLHVKPPVSFLCPSIYRRLGELISFTLGGFKSSPNTNSLLSSSFLFGTTVDCFSCDGCCGLRLEHGKHGFVRVPDTVRTNN